MKKTFTIGLLLINLFAEAQFTDHSNKIEERVNKQVEQLNRNSSGLLTCSLNDFDTFLNQEKLSKASQVQIIDSSLYRQWNQSTNQWITTNKNEYYYDNNFNLTKDVYKTSAELRTNKVTEYSYDTKGNRIQSIVSVWSKSTNQLVNSAKIEYTYDSNNNQTQRIDYNWNSTKNDWSAVWKYEYTFDANGNVKLYVLYEWSKISNQWIISYKEECTYDSNNKQTLNVSSNWNISRNELILYRKIESIFDVNGNMTQTIKYDWFSDPKLWGIREKVEHTYDTNKYLNEVINYSYFTYYSDAIVSEVEKKTKSDYMYESDGDVAEILYYSWDDASNKWRFKNKDEFTYGTNNNWVQNDQFYWDIENESWAFLFRFINFYSEHSRTSIDGFDNEIIALYPNPVSDNLQIRLAIKSAKFELYDIKGNKLLSKEINNSETLDLKNYKKGIYIYHILSDGEKHIGRLLKD